MSKRKPLNRQQQLANEDRIENEEEPKRKKANKNNRNAEFIVPPMDQRYESCTQPGIDLKLLEQGAEESLRFQGTVAGQLTQQIYELIRSDTLSASNLERCHKWKGESSEIEYYYLRSRYFVSEENGMVCDRKRDNRIVCEPASMFHLVMCSHLQNNHVTSYNIHRNLVKSYANITRDYIVTAISYCSQCNPDLNARPFQKKRHKNVYWELLPLERVHIEVFEPFDGEKIQGRFSHLLYCRDYFSRYVWVTPLQNDKRKHLIRAISSFLLSLPRIPIFLESTTVDRDHLFDLCGQIAGQYSLKLGLGVKNSQRFHNTGIKDIKELFASHKDECLEDWNLCLKYGPFHINQNINVSSDGRPGDLLFTSVPDCNRKFMKKRNEVVADTPSKDVVNLGEGVLFLENNKDEHKDAETIKENITHISQDDNQDGERVDRANADENKVRNGDMDSKPSQAEPIEPTQNTTEGKKDEKASSNPKSSTVKAAVNIPNDNHVNVIRIKPFPIGHDYIYDSDELANYDIEIEQKRTKLMKQSHDSGADDNKNSDVKPRRKRKLLSRKLQHSTSVDDSIEL